MTGQVNFGSHTDHIVASAAALVNVATAGERRGRPYAVPEGPALVEAVGSALRAGSRSAGPPTAGELAAFVALAEAIRPVFELVAVDDLDEASQTVNQLLARYRPTPYLDRHDGQPWHLHFHGRSGDDPTEWGGGMSVGLATVLGSEYPHRLGVCRANACDRVFVDVSRNGTRRFCSVACQNRVKAASHRARQA
jgi:predicted RNA-binding Zn ribbon-like protein